MALALLLHWYGEDSSILRFYAVMTGKYVTTCRWKYIVYVLGPHRSRIEAYSARFEGIPFALLKIYVLCYVTLRRAAW